MGIVRPRACGMSVSSIRPAVAQGTPLAINACSCCMSGGISRMNVKIRSDRNIGGRISRMTYLSSVRNIGVQDISSEAGGALEAGILRGYPLGV